MRRLALCVAALASVVGCSFEPDPAALGPLNTSTSRDMPASRDVSSAREDQGSVRRDMSTSPTARDMAPRIDMRADAGDLGPDRGPDIDMAPDMPPTMQVCGGSLVDVATSAQHCGGCDNACDPVRGSCQRRACVCRDGLSACAANLCVDTDRDPSNCGRCGFRCDAGQVCLQGRCTCRDGLTLCDGNCVDTARDPRYCGGCTNDCGDNACRSGECQAICPLTWFSCTLASGGRACIPLTDQDDPLFCDPSISDPCGDVCGADEVCAFAGTLNLRCRSYRVGINCTSCPCDDCGELRCITRASAPGTAMCLN